MADNTETCGNCGTNNPAGQDFCVKCHQPLTASAEEGIREGLDAQEEGGTLGQRTGFDVGVMGGGGTLIPSDLGQDTSATTDPMRHEGVPSRHA
jgi:hypothetical protein